MSWPLTPDQRQQIGALSNRYPFVWLFSVEVPTNPVTRLRLAAYDEAIEFGTTSDGEPVTWEPYAFEVGDFGEDSGGGLPQITVSASNVTREAQALLEAHDGLGGQPCDLQLVNVTTLAAGAYLRYTGEILSANTTDEVATLEIGSHSLQRAVMPAGRALRDFCRRGYRDNRCGYTGPLPTCDKTRNGPNGCVVHENAPRFGGFPSIPKPGTVL